MDKKEHWYKSPAMQDALSLAGHAVGGLLVVAAKALSWPAFLVSTFSVTAAQIAHERKQINKEEKKLLHFYGDKIGTLLHKDPATLALDDLYTAARAKEQGGLGITTLCKQVDKFENFRTVKTIGRIVSMAVIAGTVVAATALSPGILSGLAAVSILGSFSAVVGKTVDGITDSILRKKDEGRVSQQVMAIDQQVKQTGVSPIQVLDVFVKARPELQKAIASKYNNYNELTAYQKMQIVNDSEHAMHIGALTNAINKGSIKANLLGLIAYNDNFEELPDYQRYKALTNAPAPAQDSAVASPSQHVEKLLTARQEHLLAPKTIH